MLNTIRLCLYSFVIFHFKCKQSFTYSILHDLIGFYIYIINNSVTITVGG